MVGDNAGWLAMYAMYVKSEPQAIYLLAAACKLDGSPVDPFRLVELFPSATDIVSLPPPDERPVPEKVQSTLAGILKRHQEISLRDWQDVRVLYCEYLVQDLEEEWHSLRRASKFRRTSKGQGGLDRSREGRNGSRTRLAAKHCTDSGT